MNDPIQNVIRDTRWIVVTGAALGLLAVVVKINVDALKKRKRNTLQKVKHSLTLPSLRDDKLADATPRAQKQPTPPE
jgi:hypothetical protein